MKFSVTTAFGLEAIVKQELIRLGYAPQIDQPGRVCFEGTEIDVCRTNLWLRTADRVCVELARFPAPDFDALFDTLTNLDISHWIPADAAFPVSGRTHNSRLTSLPAIQRATKKGLVISLQKFHNKQDLPETGVAYPLEIVLKDDQATLLLDTTGIGLHQRGYRTSPPNQSIKPNLNEKLSSKR